MSKDPFLEQVRLGARSPTLIEYEEIPHLPRLKRRAREYALVDLARTGAVSRNDPGRRPPSLGPDREECTCHPSANCIPPFGPGGT